MRIERAIDAFLDWRRLERDATPRSIDSYWRILVKLAEEYPEATLESLATHDLRRFLGRWREKSASTRSNVISVLHSFFAWAEAEGVIDADPSRKIRRPPKRKPDIYRPSLDELERVRRAAVERERPAILLMEGAGFRSSEVLGCRWADLDLVRGRARVHRKGLHWHWLPIDRDVVAGLRQSFRSLQPELDDYVFTVEVDSGSRSTTVCAGRRIRNSRQAHKLCCEWSGVSANEPAFVASPLISFGTDSQTDSYVRVDATSSHCRL